MLKAGAIVEVLLYDAWTQMKVIRVTDKNFVAEVDNVVTLRSFNDEGKGWRKVK